MTFEAGRFGPVFPGIEAVYFDGSPRWRVDGDSLRQDFDLIDSETALVLGFELIEEPTADGPTLLWSDRVARVHADGTEEAVWSLLEDVPYQERDGQFPPPEHDTAVDWAHTNYLELRSDGNVYRIALVLRAGMILDPAAGELVGALGLSEDFSEPATQALENPHSLWPLDDGYLVFDQRGGGQGCGSVKRFGFGQTPPEILPLNGQCFQPGFLGNAQPLPDGTVMVTWSEAGRIERRDWDGTLLGEVTTGRGPLRLRRVAAAAAALNATPGHRTSARRRVASPTPPRSVGATALHLTCPEKAENLVEPCPTPTRSSKPSRSCGSCRPAPRTSARA